MNEVPFFSIILRPVLASIQPVWKSFCAFRWLLSRPLNTLILPKFVPGFVKIPILKHVPHICIGEVRLLDISYLRAWLLQIVVCRCTQSNGKRRYNLLPSFVVVFCVF
jgi:hypothetical protein